MRTERFKIQRLRHGIPLFHKGAGLLGIIRIGLARRRQQFLGSLVRETHVSGIDFLLQDGRPRELRKVPLLGSVGRDHQNFTFSPENGPCDFALHRRHESDEAAIKIQVHPRARNVGVADHIDLRGIQGDAVQLLQQFERFGALLRCAGGSVKRASEQPERG